MAGSAGITGPAAMDGMGGMGGMSAGMVSTDGREMSGGRAAGVTAGVTYGFIPEK